MDGKYITIVLPADSESEFYNYKGRYSMLLLGIANANNKFSNVQFWYKWQSFRRWCSEEHIAFWKLQNGLLNIPPADYIRNAISRMPYVFVDADAFPLRDDLMKPFRHLTNPENMQLSLVESKTYVHRKCLWHFRCTIQSIQDGYKLETTLHWIHSYSLLYTS